MTRPGIEPQSPGPLTNTLPIWPNDDDENNNRKRNEQLCFSVLLSLQKNNGPFHLAVWKEREEKEHTCQREKESKYNKERKRVGGNNIYQALIVCFYVIEEKKKK